MTPWRGFWQFMWGLAGSPPINNTRIFAAGPTGTPQLFGAITPGTARLFSSGPNAGTLRIFKT